MLHPAHRLYPLTFNVGCKHRPEAVLPHTHRLVTDVDPAFEQQVFDAAQRQWELHIHHYRQANDLG